MTKDLTAGKPLKSIIFFMLPIMIGNIFQQLYSMADTIIVGQTISSQALAGVGVTNSMSLLIIGFVQGLTSGFSVKTSQMFGAHDEEGVKKSLAASLALSAAISVALTFLAVYTTMPLLRLMDTPEDIIGYSYDYIVAVYWGLAATVFYNLGSAMLRAVGVCAEKGIPIFVTPYYLSLLNPTGTGYDDTAIRSYVIYSASLVDTFGRIRAKFPSSP